MNQAHIVWSAESAFISASLTLASIFGAFFILEPSVGKAITDQFLVSQSITDEISFLTTANDVSMSPALAGITGGVSTGTTTVRVLTNNATGYNMTLVFSSSTAMNGNTQGGSIPNYTPTSTTTPDFTFSVAANAAEFAYTVGASTTADLDTTFRNNASVCNNNSGGDTAFSCWQNPSTTAETIVNRTTPTAVSGATTSIAFRLQINSNPTPAIPEDTYTATATLTAVNN